jgi:hypothetical protein
LSGEQREYEVETGTAKTGAAGSNARLSAAGTTARDAGGSAWQQVISAQGVRGAVGAD